MNNTERGLKIIDIFTNLQEHVSKIGGYLDQDRSIIPENPTCGTTACIGGWLADILRLKYIPILTAAVIVDFTMRALRNYQIG